MTTAPIPFVPQQASGNERLGGAMPIAMNVFMDQAGVIRKRPGLRYVTGGPQAPITSSVISGLHKCLNGDIYAVAESGGERNVYRVVGAASSLVGGGAGPVGLRGTGRPQFAETEMLLAMVGGDAMQKLEFATITSSRMLDSPPVASHILTKSLRLLANDLVIDRTKVRFSDIASGTVTFAGNEKWTPSGTNDAGFFSAEARPDPVVALIDTAELVFVLGSTTIEAYIADATQKFARVAVIDNGCGAAYAVTKIEQDVYLLDNQKRVLKGRDHGFKSVGDPIQGTLDAINVTGAFAYRVSLGPIDSPVFTFPADGRTFAYSPGIGWAQWSSWNGTIYGQHLVNSCDAFTLIGTSTGQIGEYSLDAFDDFGSPIRAYIESGFQGDGQVRDCQRVLISLKRGVSGASTAPTCQLSWRDRPGPFEEPIQLDLGSSSDTHVVVEVTGLGTYRYRQWRFEMTGGGELGLVGAMEQFEVTGS